MKFKLIILVNIGCIIYLLGSIIYCYYQLTPLEGTLIKTEKSKNRIPIYTLQLKEYSCVFRNTGNSLLSLFTDNKKVYQSLLQSERHDYSLTLIDKTETVERKNNIYFYIRKQDIPGLSTHSEIFYFNAHLSPENPNNFYKWIDAYYYTLRGWRGGTYILFFFVLAVITLIGTKLFITQNIYSTTIGLIDIILFFSLMLM